MPKTTRHSRRSRNQSRPSSKRRTKRNKRRQGILGPIFLELLAVIVMLFLFVTIRQPAQVERPEIQGEFPAIAYVDSQINQP